MPIWNVTYVARGIHIRRPLAIGIMAPVTGELLQRPSFKGKERELLLFGAVLSILDKVLGVFVVWQGKHVRTHLFLSSHFNCVRRAGFRFYRHLISSVNFNHY